MAEKTDVPLIVEQTKELIETGSGSELLEKGTELLMQYGMKVLAAIAILIVGRMIAKWLRRMITRMMERAEVDPMIIGFASSITYIALLFFVIVAALGALGVQTTSLIAVLGAAGLAVGLALQGSLANFAAGFLLIIFRPFKQGDFIEAAGVAGKVENIHIFTTTLKTPDNKTIIIPNGKLSADNIINYSAEENRRVEITVGVSYDADLKQVRGILEDLISGDQRVLDDPASLVAVSELAENSVNLVMRMWVKSGDFWDVTFDMNEAIKNRLDEAGIGIPYPQRDIHLYQHKVE
jgi:small conductance mechanosensitive channel